MDEELLLFRWIKRDMAENAALAEFYDVDDALKPVKQETMNMLIPKFRIDGKTKKYKKAHKRKEIPTIPEARIEEFREMMTEIETLKENIAKQKASIDKAKVSNAKAHREILEGKQFLEKLRTAVEDKKLEHLQLLEESRIAAKKEKIETNRSKKAQAEISQKRNAATQELDRLTEEFKQMESAYADFKSARDKEKKQLERKIKTLRKETEVLKVERSGIEKQLAERSQFI